MSTFSRINPHPPPLSTPSLLLLLTLASRLLSLTIARMASELLGLSSDLRLSLEDLVDSSKLLDRLASFPASP